MSVRKSRSSAEGGGAPLVCSEAEVRPYVLAGPQTVVARCSTEFGDDDETMRLGFLTPAARVTPDPRHPLLLAAAASSYGNMP